MGLIYTVDEDVMVLSLSDLADEPVMGRVVRVEPDNLIRVQTYVGRVAGDVLLVEATDLCTLREATEAVRRLRALRVQGVTITWPHGR